MPRRTILIVEDNADSRLILATVLKRAGYKVLEAEDGPEALTVAARSEPDLILLDIAVPGVDGWAVATLLLGSQATALIPVVAVTAYDGLDERARAARLGFRGFLTKPVDPFDVLEYVAGMIGPADRRAEITDRRSMRDRRVANLPVLEERRSGFDRRIGADRRKAAQNT